MAAAWLVSGGKLPFGVKPPTPNLNRAHPLAQGLVFDANYFAPGLGGNIERAGQTSRSTYTGTATSIGPHGVARTFAGGATTDADTYVSNAAVNSIGQVTIEVLFKPNGAAGGNVGRILLKGGAGGRLTFQHDTTNNWISFRTIWGTNDGAWNTPTSSVTIGSWHHVVLTYQFDTAADPVIRINGALQTITESSAPAGTAPVDSTGLIIGNRDDGTRGVNGDFSHLRLWNRMLSGGEAAQLYADPFGIYVGAKRRALGAVPSLTQTLTPSLFTNTPVFYGPTVTPGSVTLTPSLFTNSNTFYSPTVSQAGATQTLTPSLFTNSSTFYSPTITAGAVTLSPGLFTNSSTFYGPTVTPGARTLTPGLFTNSSSFYAPTVTRGTVTLSPSLFTNANTFYGPTITTGAVTLSPALFTNASAFYSPTVFVPGGLQTLLPSLFTNLSVFYAGAVNQNDPPGTYPLAIEGDPTTTQGRLLSGGSVVAGSIPTTGRVIASALRGRP